MIFFITLLFHLSNPKIGYSKNKRCLFQTAAIKSNILSILSHKLWLLYICQRKNWKTRWNENFLENNSISVKIRKEVKTYSRAIEKNDSLEEVSFSSFNDLKRKKIKEISREGNISIEMEKVSDGQDKFGTFPWVIERERERKRD